MARKGRSIHIGVDHSVAGKGRDAPGAIAAAKAMQKIAEDLHYEEPVLLAGADATIDKFKNAFSNAMPGMADDDILFITMAAHGKALLADGQCPGSHNQAVFLATTLMIDDDFYAMLASIPVAARVIVVADVCHGTALLDRIKDFFKTKLEDDKQSLVHRLFDGLTTAPSNMFICQPKVRANILLIAPDGSTPGSTDPAILPDFTKALVDSLPTSDTYAKLVKNMTTNLNGGATALPILGDRLVTNAAFVGERPFSIV